MTEAPHAQYRYGPPDQTSGPTSWLVWSILSTLCCCAPLGIVGIVYSSLAMAARDRGEWSTMDDYVGKARGWTIAAIVLGLVLIVIVVGMGAGDY